MVVFSLECAPRNVLGGGSIDSSSSFHDGGYLFDISFSFNIVFVPLLWRHEWKLNNNFGEADTIEE